MIIDIQKLIAENDTLFQHISEIESNFLTEFDYRLNGRSIHFTKDFYEKCMEVIQEMNLSIYTKEYKDLESIVHEGVTLMDFLKMLFKGCELNLYFFVSEIARVVDYSGEYHKFNMDIGRSSQLIAINKGFNTLLYNPRQSGQTALLAAIYEYFRIFRRGSYILLYTRNSLEHNDFMRRVDCIEQSLPFLFLDEKFIKLSKYYTYNKYILANDFEYLDDMDLHDIINQLANDKSLNPLSKFDIQFIGCGPMRHSTPSRMLEGLISTMSKMDDATIFYNPEDCIKDSCNKKEKILSVVYDANLIFTQDTLQHFKDDLPEDAYKYEVLRVRN